MHLRRIFVVLLAVAVMFGAAAMTPAAAHHGASGKLCIVNDIGGSSIPFNVAAAAGAKEAEAKLHVEVVTLDADTEADVTANIDTFVTSGDCDLIIGVGFIIAFLLEPFIAANPGQQFAVIDFSFGGVYEANTAEVLFRSDEAAFLAGYIAAGISETGKVACSAGSLSRR